jgi:sugar lactone lactonase YvrE
MILQVSSLGVVTTLAGVSGNGGGTDGTGAAAIFNNPMGLTVDGAGNVYVADTYNATIRKITPAGMVTTLAGTAGMSGSADGTGTAARFNSPTGLAVDGAGNIYVADTYSATIRKITPTGMVTTLAGVTGVAGIRIGAMPRFGFPAGLVIAGDSLFVSDTNAILVLRHIP